MRQRKELKQLLGKKVVYEGNYVESKIKQSGKKLVLLSPITITPYGEPDKTFSYDHLWINIPIASDKEKEELSQLFHDHENSKERTTGLGQVIKYQRKTGSFDYGLKAIPSQFFDYHAFYQQIKYLMSKQCGNKKKLKDLASTKEAIPIVIESVKNQNLMLDPRVSSDYFIQVLNLCWSELDSYEKHLIKKKKKRKKNNRIKELKEVS